MSATKALTRSRKRRAVADRPSSPGNRSLWFVTAERVREGSSPEEQLHMALDNRTISEHPSNLCSL